MGVYSVYNESATDFSTPIEINGPINFMAEAYNVVAESNTNYNNIMRAIGIAELNYFEENGMEMIYEESGVKAMFGKFIAFFKALLAKIGNMFHKFFAMFAQFTMSDKDFVKKYQKDLVVKDLKDFEYKGYKFTPAFASPALSAAYTDAGITSAETLASKKENDAAVVKALEISEDMDTTEESLRKLVAGASSSLTQKEFTEELFKKFRNGEDSKDTLKCDSVRPYLSYLEGSAKVVNDAKKQYRDAEKAIKDAITICEKAETNYSKELVKDEKKSQKVLKAMTTSIDVAKAFLNFVTMANGASLTAYKDESRQAKAICVKALSYKKPVNASYSYANEGSFLGDVIIK